MINFSNKVNMVNKQILEVKTNENEIENEVSENSFSSSKIDSNSKLHTLRERREKALNFAKKY